MFQYLLYRLTQGMVSVLPLRFSYWISHRIADLHFLFSHRSRRQVLKNLHWIDGGDPSLQRSRGREVFRHFGEYLVDFLRLSVIPNEEFLKCVEVAGIEHIQKSLQKGKGLIVVTAHFGNWEWGGVELSLLGYPVHAVALSHRNRWVNDFFVRQRSQKGVHVIPMDGEVWEIIQHLSKNEIVLLVADRDFSNNGIPVSFLGRKVCLPRGPAALSRRCGSPLVVGFVIRHKKGSFRLVFEAPIEPERTRDFSLDLEKVTQRLGGLLENYIRRYPTQWLLFEGLREAS